MISVTPDYEPLVRTDLSTEIVTTQSNVTRPRKNLVSERFGRLIVVALTGNRTSSGKIEWECRCDCGAIVKVAGGSLLSGNTKSCGCFAKTRQKEANLKHGGTSWLRGSEAEYRTLRGIIGRCHNTSNPKYKDYGARGISVCDRWRFGEDGVHAYELFLRDMGRKPSPEHSIERRDNDGNYEPNNCVWATRKEQAQNTRSVIRTELGSLSEYARIHDVNQKSLWYRVRKLGETPEDAVKELKK